MDLTILLPVLVAIVGALGAYLASVRKLSGTVKTSTADDLWEESREIRRDYQRRIQELNKVIDQCRERLEAVEIRNAELHKQNGDLRESLREHTRTIDTLRETVLHLERENTELRAENLALQRRVSELEGS